MTHKEQQQLGKTLWDIAVQLRGAMNADDFRDYMLSFLFLRYLSDNYEKAAKKELGKDYPLLTEKDNRIPLSVWYSENKDDVKEFEKQMRRKIHYVIKPEHLWNNIAEMARTQNDQLLVTLEEGFRYIENESFESTFQGLFSEINLNSEKLGKTSAERNKNFVLLFKKLLKELLIFNRYGYAWRSYEYLIGQFAAGSNKKAGEFYTPQQLSTILSEIVSLDSQDQVQVKKNLTNPRFCLRFKTIITQRKRSE